MEADGRTAPLRSILIFLHRCLFCPHNLGQYICGRDTCQEAGHLLKSNCKQFHISLSDLPHISQSYGVPRGRIVCRKEYSVRMRKNTGTKDRATSETAAEASFVKTDFLKERKGDLFCCFLCRHGHLTLAGAKADHGCVSLAKSKHLCRGTFSTEISSRFY